VEKRFPVQVSREGPGKDSPHPHIKQEHCNWHGIRGTTRLYSNQFCGLGLRKLAQTRQHFFHGPPGAEPMAKEKWLYAIIFTKSLSVSRILSSAAWTGGRRKGSFHWLLVRSSENTFAKTHSSTGNGGPGKRVRPPVDVPGACLKPGLDRKQIFLGHRTSMVRSRQQ
jgi:hypothetical protein